MQIQVNQETLALLSEYGRISIAFTVNGVFDVTVRAAAPRGFLLAERPIQTPYVKNYDTISDEGPASWAERFDMSNWALFAAYDNESRGGEATVAFKTPNLTMLDGRADSAVVWDILVSPDAQSTLSGVESGRWLA